VTIAGLFDKILKSTFFWRKEAAMSRKNLMALFWFFLSILWLITPGTVYGLVGNALLAMDCLLAGGIVYFQMGPEGGKFGIFLVFSGMAGLLLSLVNQAKMVEALFHLFFLFAGIAILLQIAAAIPKTKP
jgi:hypothetical protein